MDLKRVAALAFAVVSVGAASFQFALALGAPWGAYALAGSHPGQVPQAFRVAAVIQGVLILLMAAVVLARAGVALPRWSRASRWLVWLIVAFGAVSLVLNLITPVAVERAIWAPVAFVMLASSLIVALGKERASDDPSAS